MVPYIPTRFSFISRIASGEITTIQQLEELVKDAIDVGEMLQTEIIRQENFDRTVAANSGNQFFGSEDPAEIDRLNEDVCDLHALASEIDSSPQKYVDLIRRTEKVNRQAPGDLGETAQFKVMDDGTTQGREWPLLMDWQADALNAIIEQSKIELRRNLFHVPPKPRGAMRRVYYCLSLLGGFHTSQEILAKFRLPADNIPTQRQAIADLSSFMRAKGNKPEVEGIRKAVEEARARRARKD